MFTWIDGVPKRGDMPEEKPDPETARESAKLIDDSADLITTAGLAHGVYHDREGRYCVLGALSTIANKRETLTDDVRTWVTIALHREVKKITGGSTTLTFWNDRNDQETVVNMMRAAAERLRTEAEE